MTANVRRWALLCAVIGLAAASASLLVHYRLLTQVGYVSPCDINATFSCSDAYRSQGTRTGPVRAAGYEPAAYPHADRTTQTQQRAHSVVLDIHRKTRNFPDDERFGLVSQMRRAAVSVSTNIAEGAAARAAPSTRAS